MFDWLGDILSGLGDALSVVFEGVGADIAVDIWNALVEWIYNTVFDAVADLFTSMNNMGAEIFSLSWVNAVVRLFTLFGWALFTVGVVGAVFEVAIESQSGRVSIKGAALNVLKGFFACALIGVLPVELYKFCVSLQNSFAGDLTRIFSSAQGATIGEIAVFILRAVFRLGTPSEPVLKLLFFLLAFSYCTIKVFFANIKRGGILLIQIAVGSLYMFSVPRGYTDGFNQWCKQVMAICLTAFLQTTLLFLGMLTLQDSMLMGLGIMLTANEVPRIAQQFGLDSSVRVNVSSMVYSTSSENEKYTFRTWLLWLGLIGDEFKTARQHLLKNLDGNIAWKDPAQAERQRERLMQQRLEQARASAPNTVQEARQEITMEGYHASLHTNAYLIGLHSSLKRAAGNETEVKLVLYWYRIMIAASDPWAMGY